MPLVVFFISGFVYFFKSTKSTEANSDIFVVSQQDSKLEASSLFQIQLSGYNFCKPIILNDFSAESVELNDFKKELTSFVNYRKDLYSITTSSVYIWELDKAKWVSINPEERYSPGSLLKIPSLIVFLRQSESDPTILERKLLFDKRQGTAPKQSISSDPLKSGNYYTIRDLIFRMITKSDNDATFLLNNIIDVGAFEKVFTDLGLDKPNVSDKNYSLTVREFSRFMRVLYNGTYLSKQNSEYALSLLNKTEFRNGVTKNIPKDIRVANKFGESTYLADWEFHESAIVYAHNNPFLITVMTKGKDISQMSSFLQDVGKFAYDNLSAVK